MSYWNRLGGLICVSKEYIGKVEKCTKAELMTRGADKYGDNNWQLANSEEELNRFKSSAFRHFIQWLSCEDDEDHAMAVFFNITAYETIKEKVYE